MTEQQSPPEQMVTGEGAGERGGNYKVRGDGGDALPVHVVGWSLRCYPQPGATWWQRHPWVRRCHQGTSSAWPPAAAAASWCVCHLPVTFPLGLQRVQLQEMEHCCGSLLGQS